MTAPSSGAAGLPRTTPFAGVRADVAIALPFAVLALVWAVAGGLPGGRWAAVHLFTLGVLAPLIVGFSQHQASTLLRAATPSRRPVRVLLVAGAALVAGGMIATSAPGATTAIAVGGTLSALGVAIAGWWLWRARRVAGAEARFGWLIGAYVHAHGAFVAGAVAGGFLGARAVPGVAYLPLRHAHLHTMLVGFAALTLLATAVLFGPMLLRAQFEPGAERQAARALPVAAGATIVAVAGLLAGAAPAPWALGARWLAGAALLVVAGAGVAVTAPLVRTMVRKASRAPLAGVLLTYALAWLTLALAADGIVVATGRWLLLDAIGAVALLGGFVQAIVATLLHVVTMWLPRPRRLRALQRVEAIPVGLAVVPQLAVAGWALVLFAS
jgi:hypothetical protein